MILQDVRLPVGYTDEMLEKAVFSAARKRFRIHSVRILRRSIDARKKPKVFYVLKLAVNEKDEQSFRMPKAVHPGEKRVAVIGSGPAGLFAAKALSEAGLLVTVFERGKKVEDRERDVERFFESGTLDPESNIQFGEGGAGTFSDGKLNTRVQDPDGLNAYVLNSFYEAGADESVTYDAMAHIGTDRLPTIISNLRKQLEANGVTFRFSTKISGISFEDGCLKGLFLKTDGGPETFEEFSRAVLAIGHSARDTFLMLKEKGLEMEKKAFAIGVRIEHPQEMITLSQYGTLDYEELGAAPYRLAYHAKNGRGVYSFCMCPGGSVVNASSEKGRLCINGMSNAKRDGKNANSGLVVQVTEEDFPGDDVLSGMHFQERLEEKAYGALSGKIPLQLLGDFLGDTESEAFGGVTPDMKGAYGFSRLSTILPEAVTEALKEAIPEFGKRIEGFDREDALLSAVEARTSSPVRILRNEAHESSIRGLYPAGEGAGYAGGIVSAAIDGVRTAVKIVEAMNAEEGVKES